MLSKVEQSSNAEKQIVVRGSSGVLYTVPSGKSFDGYVTFTNSAGSFLINGVQVEVGVSAWHPIRLLSGSVVSGSSGALTLIGVEK